MLPLCVSLACEYVCWQVEHTASAALVSALQARITALTLENQELANKLKVCVSLLFTFMFKW